MARKIRRGRSERELPSMSSGLRRSHREGVALFMNQNGRKFGRNSRRFRDAAIADARGIRTKTRQLDHGVHVDEARIAAVALRRAWV
jgi:hypothetical protein